MNKKIVTGLCSFALMAFLAVAWPTYAQNQNHSTEPGTTAQQSDQAQSVSGTIASLGRNSFTLTVNPSSATEPGHSFRQQTSSRSMTFMINKNTTVDGKLKVGANADVTYREENGNNVAISVRVMS